ncbi:MAG: hypothetical protein DCC65_00400 [Planctomycetota bacterium]|nr:MAG: hypothetical protein DCC65_00400 [Planctomycetota bacterium]
MRPSEFSRFGVVGRRFQGRARRGARAFSLIEILLVTSVSAVLVGILVPALSRAREAGRASVCLAALRAGGLATQMYLDDNEGRFWPYFQDVASPEAGRRWWFGFERGGPAANAMSLHRPIDKAAGFLGKYLTSTSADFVCPGFPYTSGKYFAKFSPAAGGYGYNTAGLGGGGQGSSSGAPRAIQEFVGRTSDVFVLADGIHFDRLDYSGPTPLGQTFNEPAYIEWQEPSLFSRNAGVNGGFGHFRHNGRAQVLYMDGHAAGQPPRRTPHPFGRMGHGPVGNLSDDALRTIEVRRGRATLHIDVIYGLRG